MKKFITSLLVAAIAAALMAPGAVLAKPGNGNGKGQQNAASSNVDPVDPAAAAARDARKAERLAAKEVRKAERAAAKEARIQVKGAGEGVETEDESGSVEPSESVEPTVGAGIPNAFSRITSNLEKALAKVAAGTKKSVPPGLARVWLKFAAWLGVDPSTMPGVSGPVGEPTSTVEPTPTVEPTATVDPTSTVTPTDTVGSPVVPAP